MSRPARPPQVGMPSKTTTSSLAFWKNGALLVARKPPMFTRLSFLELTVQPSP